MTATANSLVRYGNDRSNINQLHRLQIEHFSLTVANFDLC